MNETKDLKTEKGMPVTENKMGYMPIRPLMISMSLPAIISMTINALYNIVDSYFVARISEDALTAVSIIMPLQMMIIAVGVGTGVGINSLISRRLGARRQEDADKAIAIRKEVSATAAANLKEQMIQNIAKGRMAKFFKESCLVDQEFQFGDEGAKESVAQWLAKQSKDLKVVAYKRFSLSAD